MHDLDLQGRAAGGQLTPRDLVGRQQRALAADQTDQGGTAALGKAQHRQLRVQASPFPAATLAGSFPWTAVECADKQDQAAQQTQRQRPFLGLSQGPSRLRYFFFACSCRAGCWAACARRLATRRSAICWKAW